MQDENTLWYDTVLNQIIQGNEHPKLATPLQEGSEEKTETTSSPPSEGEA
jgi:hypothetical protein